MVKVKLPFIPFGNYIEVFYIWCMKFLAPIPSNIECRATIIRSNKNVVMYDVSIDHEIIGYFVGINTPYNENMVEFIDHDAADIFFDKLNIRVEMSKRGICLN